MNWLNLIFQLIPAILQTVVAVENTVKAPGATKKSIAQGVLNAAVVASNAVAQVDHGKVSTVVSGLIDSTVKVLNDTGVFQAPTPQVTK